MKSSLKSLLILGPFLGLAAGIALDRFVLTDKHKKSVSAVEDGHARHAHTQSYVCPMHPEIVSGDSSASCPICGMDLVPVKDDELDTISEEGKPVVSVSSAIMNSLGVRTAPVVRKDIVRRVVTPGFIQQIKKGQQSKVIISYAGKVTALLFEKGEWNETGAPLMELESEALLAAQKKHLELFNVAKKSTNENTADNMSSEEVLTDASDSVAETEAASGETDDDSLLSTEQRGQLAGMGLPEAAIAQMEQKMKVHIGSEAANSPMSAAPDEATVAKEQPDAVDDTSSDKVTEAVLEMSEETAKGQVQTLEESRRKLHRMGLRLEDIERLETKQEPSSIVILHASHPGKVMGLKVSAGDTFDTGAFLFRLGGQVRAIVLANAFQRDAAWISTGYRVEVRMPHVSGEVWEGIVNQGAVSINPNSQNIGVKLAFTAPLNKVRNNQYVVGTIFGDARKDVLSVPREAVIRTETEERVVVALGGGKFQPVLVTTGVEAGDEVEIIEGLKEGDEVVVMSQFLIDSESSLKASFNRLGEE
jgi:biotin carboxyl carrier protein